MVKIYPAQEITKCDNCPNNLLITRDESACKRTLNMYTDEKVIKDFIIPSWCPLPDKIEERLRPSDLTWEDKHPSNYKFEKVNVD